MVGIAGDKNRSAVSLARLVDGVGEDLKDGMLAALESVGAEDDRRAQPDAVGALEGGNGLVSIGFLLFHADSSQYFVLVIGIKTHYIDYSILSFPSKVKFSARREKLSKALKNAFETLGYFLRTRQLQSAPFRGII